MRYRILMLLTVAAFADFARAQAPVAQGDPAPAMAQAPLPPRGITVPVMINGQGPFQFAIDSGSTTTLIATELADQLHLPRGDQLRVQAMGGSASLRTVKIDRIQVAGNEQRDLKLAAVPRTNLEADGLLGLNLLKDQRIVMDFVERSIRIEPSTTQAEAPAADREDDEDFSEIVVQARRRHGQLVMVDADANGQKVWVIVDSGSQASLGNIKLMQLLVKRAPGIAILPVTLTDVIGRTIDARYTNVDRLRLGGIALGDIPIAFADAHPFKLFDLMKKPSLLLGMETLQNFTRVTIDFPSRKVTFQVAKEKLTVSPTATK